MEGNGIFNKTLRLFRRTYSEMKEDETLSSDIKKERSTKHSRMDVVYEEADRDRDRHNNSSERERRMDQYHQAQQRIHESGDKERLKQYLHAELIECGWRDNMKEMAKEIIRSRGGVTKITVDELASELMQRGKSTVPDQVRLSLKRKLREDL